MSEDITLLSNLAALAAVAVALVAIYQYWKDRYRAQLKHRRNEVMNEIAGLTIEMYQQRKSIEAAIAEDDDIGTTALASMRRNANRLYELIDNAARLGLRHKLMALDPGGSMDNAREHWGAFRDGLAELHELDPKRSEMSDYVHKSVSAGIVRLASQCMAYDPMPLEKELARLLVPSDSQGALRLKKLRRHKALDRLLHESNAYEGVWYDLSLYDQQRHHGIVNQIAAVIAPVYNDLVTIASSLTHEYEVDNFIYYSIQHNANRLDKLLDEAVGVGHLQILRGDHLSGDKNISIIMWNAFRSGLHEVVRLDAETATSEDYTKQHFVMGVIRLMDQCRQHADTHVASDIHVLLEGKESLVEEAWNYL